jgi:hypothetical protein
MELEATAAGEPEASSPAGDPAAATGSSGGVVEAADAEKRQKQEEEQQQQGEQELRREAVEALSAEAAAAAAPEPEPRLSQPGPSEPGTSETTNAEKQQEEEGQQQEEEELRREAVEALSAEAAVVPAGPAVDTKTGLQLVLGHPVAAMPTDRATWRAPVPIRYDDDCSSGRGAGQERAAVAVAPCTHESCRNNPACSAPFDRDCTPQANDGMPPGGATKVLLHSCCAPCSGAMFEEMLSKGLDVRAPPRPACAAVHSCLSAPRCRHLPAPPPPLLRRALPSRGGGAHRARAR